MSTDHFSWLPLSDRKGLPTPRVLFCDSPNANGYFFCRMERKCVDGMWLGLEFDRSESDHIVLSTHWGDTPASVFAHEHRHFQQRYITGLPQLGRPQPCRHDGTYDGWWMAVRRFYLTRPWEMDALRYSMRVHRDQASEQHWVTIQ